VSTIQDEIFRVTNGPSVPDGLATHFSKTDDESLQDAEYRWLVEQGAAPAQLNDMWIDAFGPGQINDIKLAYWLGQPTHPDFNVVFLLDNFGNFLTTEAGDFLIQ
jgi:hypothetical protein